MLRGIVYLFLLIGLIFKMIFDNLYLIIFLKNIYVKWGTSYIKKLAP